MYEENVTYKVGINWKDIIIKVVLLILFILFLLWLFPKKDLDVLYDSIYRENINTMKEAARNYYTKDRLPQNVGESTSMTLSQMLDKKLLIRFTDKNKKYCDETSSKVEVTKTAENEYVLKVQLNCGDQQDYILETIGCNDVCPSGNCDVVVDPDVPSTDDDLISTTYYQFRKPVYSTVTNYTCPSGYTKNGLYCIKSTNGATIDATPVYGEDKTITTDAKYVTSGSYKVYTDPIKTYVGNAYTCPSGYTKNGSYCIKYTPANEYIDTDYVCPDGYILSGTKCSRTYSATYREGSKQYICPDGGTLDSKLNCVVETDKVKHTTYTCPSGYTKNGTSCYKVYSADSSDSDYTCPSGYTLRGTTCYGKKEIDAVKSSGYVCSNTSDTRKGDTCYHKTTTDAKANTNYGSWVLKNTLYYSTANAAYTYEKAKLVYMGAISGSQCGSACGNSGIWYVYNYYTRTADTYYTCPNGGTVEGSKCVTYTTYKADSKPSYTCSTGVLNGTKCVVPDSFKATKKAKYTCPDGGTLSNGKCTITKKATLSYTYSCPSGYTEQDGKCVKTYKATLTNNNGYYMCMEGGTLSGTKCTITVDASQTHTKKYTCPAGYEQEGSSCKLKINATREKVYSYTCPSGYITEGSGENTKCYIIKQGTKKYYCEDINATLEGNKCIKVVKGDIIGYTCQSGYNQNGNKCTKISTETIDATATTSTKKSYKYTWSTSTVLEGWEFTGNTKVVTNNSTSQK